MGLEVDICASFSVKLTVIVSPIPALPPVIVSAVVVLKSGIVVSTLIERLREAVEELPNRSYTVTEAFMFVLPSGSDAVSARVSA